MRGMQGGRRERREKDKENFPFNFLSLHSTLPFVHVMYSGIRTQLHSSVAVGNAEPENGTLCILSR